MLETITEGLTVALSAFAGAWFAFLFERRTSKLEKEQANYAALREAHFAILQQHLQMVLLRDRFLVTEGASPVPWLTMLPVLGYFEVPRLEVPKLVFILESPDPDLLNRLLVCQQKYLALQGLIEQRNGYHSQFQERLATLHREGIVKSGNSVEEVEHHIGQPLIGQLKTITEGILSSYPPLIEFQQARLEEMQAFSTKVFPRRRAPKHEMLPVEQRK